MSQTPAPHEASMFRCTSCENQTFTLMVHPDCEVSIEVHTDDHGDVLIRAGGNTFTADLLFMNQFATCARCGTQKAWEYYYPETVKPHAR